MFSCRNEGIEERKWCRKNENWNSGGGRCRRRITSKLNAVIYHLIHMRHGLRNVSTGRSVSHKPGMSPQTSYCHVG